MDDTQDEVMRARQDAHELDAFIKKNKSFIGTQAYKVCHRYISESDDEYSVALIAFSEAIQTFDKSKGYFYSFAGLVIKRRLIDYIKSQSRFQSEYSVENDTLDGDLGEEEEISSLKLEIQEKVVEQYKQTAQETVTIRDEIEALEQRLERYGFTFMEVADASPKAKKTKEACAKLINYIVDHPEYYMRMEKTGGIPSAEICKIYHIPRKIPERHRKYIIAAIEILYGDYPQLAEYMKGIRAEA